MPSSTATRCGRKFLEEATDAAEADVDALLEELADVVEVVKALATELGSSLADVQAVAVNRARARGSFLQRVWLETTLRPENEALLAVYRCTDMAQ